MLDWIIIALLLLFLGLLFAWEAERASRWEEERKERTRRNYGR